MVDFITPLLTVGANIIGGLLGNTSDANKNTNTTSAGTTGVVQTATSDATNNVNQNLTTTTNSASSTSSNASTSGKESSSANTTSNSGTTSNNDTASKQTGQQQAVTSRLDDVTKGNLTDQVNALLKSVSTSEGQSDSQLNQLNSSPLFDSDAFVKGIMTQAKASAQTDMDSNLAKINDNTGAGTDTNSAAALLANRIRGDSVANLAGIGSQATATAAQILDQQQKDRADTLLQLTQSKNSVLDSLLGNLLNASQVESTASSVTGSESTKGGSSTSGSSNTGTNTSSSNHTSGGSATTGSSVATTVGNTTTTDHQTGTQGTATTTANTIISNEAGNQTDHNWSDILKGLGTMVAAVF